MKPFFFCSIFVAWCFAAPSIALLACGGDQTLASTASDAGLDGSARRVAREAGAVDAGPVVYASVYLDGGQIEEFQASTGYATNTIDLLFPETPNGFSPYALAMTPGDANLFALGNDLKGGPIYVAKISASGTATISPVGQSQSATQSVGDLFIAADNGSLYADVQHLDDNGYIISADLIVISSSGLPTATIAFPPPYASPLLFEGLVYSAATNVLYTIVDPSDGMSDQAIAMIDTTTNTVTKMIPIDPENPPSSYSGLAITSDGTQAFSTLYPLYQDQGAEQLHVIDLSSGAAHDISLPSNVEVVFSGTVSLLSPDNSTAYLPAVLSGDSFGGAIVAVDLASQATQTFQLPDNAVPHGPLAFDGKNIYLSAIEDNGLNTSLPVFDTVAQAFSYSLALPSSLNAPLNVTGLTVR